MPAAVVLHRKKSSVPDGADSSLVLPSDWNDTHDVQVYESAGDVPPETPSAYDDEFKETTVDPKWTTSVVSGNTLTATTNGVIFQGNAGQTARRAVLMYQNIPLVNGSAAMAKLRVLDTVENYSGIFAGPRNAAGAIDGCGIVFISPSMRHYRGALDSSGTLVSEGTFGTALGTVLYVKFTFTSTGYTMHISLDGNSWVPKFTRTYAGFLTAVTGFALYLQAYTNSANYSVEWFRVTGV